MDLPPVSCACLTYGRPHVLEEAIESFLRQDYAGEKELLILNDFDKQELHFDHPQVKVVNVNKRFKTIGEKRNASVALCSHDNIFVWDDDDIYLPHRISLSMKKLTKEMPFFKTSNAFFLNIGQMSIKSNLFHSSSCWRRELFNDVKGYLAIDSGQDYELEQEMGGLLEGLAVGTDVDAVEMYYIYRWAHTKSYHLSDFGRDNPEALKQIEHAIESHVACGLIKSGKINLNPAWREDYIKISEECLKRHYSVRG